MRTAGKRDLFTHEGRADFNPTDLIGILGTIAIVDMPEPVCGRGRVGFRVVSRTHRHHDLLNHKVAMVHFLGHRRATPPGLDDRREGHIGHDRDHRENGYREQELQQRETTPFCIPPGRHHSSSSGW